MRHQELRFGALLEPSGTSDTRGQRWHTVGAFTGVWAVLSSAPIAAMQVCRNALLPRAGCRLKGLSRSPGS